MPTATRQFLVASLIAGLLAGLLFLPGLPGQFVFDDFPNIVNNDVIHLTKLNADTLLNTIATPQVSGSMRGLPTLTFALDYWRAGGADAATFKTTNIAIHALTACALAWLFRSLLSIAGFAPRQSKWMAIALALAWAAHPLQVSSVLYVVQRLQTMGTLFLVLALVAYLHARQAQMQGNSGRTGLLTALLLWVVALGCKEDSVLLPAYTLALELTVLRFAAADARVATLLRRGYLLATLAGTAIYLFWVIPRYWEWQAYSGRNFSTPERLLTQARVLCLYIWQFLVPLPQHMPFYYDWIQPSRGLLQPWTTLPAIAVIASLLVLAWRMRHRQPLFALGVFLFFSAHFIASNVVGLELAYEHRNHFAMIGAVLAAGSVLAQVSLRLRARPALQAALCAALLVMLGSATLLRAHSWRDNVALTKASTQAAPSSPRAWVGLCAAHFEAGGGAVKDNPYLDEAIQACTSGAASATDSLNSLALLLVLKTLKGDVVQQDWGRFQNRLSTTRMSWDNARAPLILTHYASLGVKLDKQQLLKASATLANRVDLNPTSLAMIGYSVLNDLKEPELAIPYFIKAIEEIPPEDPFAGHLVKQLTQLGRPDLAAKVEEASIARFREVGGASVAP